MISLKAVLMLFAIMNVDTGEIIFKIQLHDAALPTHTEDGRAIDRLARCREEGALAAARAHEQYADTGVHITTTVVCKTSETYGLPS